MKTYYWFSKKNTLPHGDGRRIKVGRTHKVDPDLLHICHYGLHASAKPLDALKYAPGNVLWGVKLGGRIIEQTDKACASERTYLWRMDATDVLRRFARKCALDVIDLWDAPDVAVQYLKTGDEGLRAAAWDAARAARAAWDAARAAWDAARAARATQSRRLSAMIASERSRIGQR